MAKLDDIGLPATLKPEGFKIRCQMLKKCTCVFSSVVDFIEHTKDTHVRNVEIEPLVFKIKWTSRRPRTADDIPNVNTDVLRILDRDPNYTFHVMHDRLIDPTDWSWIDDVDVEPHVFLSDEDIASLHWLVDELVPFVRPPPDAVDDVGDVGRRLAALHVTG